VRFGDGFVFCAQSLLKQRMRSLLIVLSMAIGTAGVVLLTWLGDSARRYIVGQFQSLGTNLVIVLPGRNETRGGVPFLLGETPRDLTIADAQALLRSPAIARIAPLVVGGVPIGHGGRERDTTVLGSTRTLMPVRHLVLGSGDFLPDDAQSGESVCVLGATVCEELFGPASPLGEFVRVGNRRFRVCGVLAKGGTSIGTDLDEIVVLPLEASMALFDSPGLFRILVEARSREAIPAAVAECERILRERHRGELDCTVITQDAVVSTFDSILGALTAAVAGIASIALVVAGILIMNVMVVAVTQRKAEVGLLKALGAERATIRRTFLGEALMMSFGGCALGLLLGELGSRAVAHSFPALRGGVPGWAAVAAVLVAGGSGLLFGVMPAARAARLDPVLALARR